MADRWAVVDWLQKGLPYREIHRLTGVSVTTIGRVARYLADGNGGYSLAVNACSATPEPRSAASTAHRRHHETHRQRTPQARRAEVRPPHRPVARPARALRPQALARPRPAHGLRREHAARRAVRARRRHSRTWCRKTSATWAWSGVNVLEEKRLELIARGHAAHVHARLRTLDFGRCRLSLAVPEGFELRRLADRCAGKRIATTYPSHARALPARAQGHRRRDRHAVRRGRDRAAPGARRPHLRPGLHRLDAAGQSPARSRDRAREPGRC